MDLVFPLRAAFYYPWFPETTFGRYVPSLGLYDSTDPAIIVQHTEWLAHARIRVAIASWWGPDHHREAELLPLLLDAAAQIKWPLTWCVYYEKGEAGHDEVKRDLDYLEANYISHPRWAHVDYQPAVFVYDTMGACEVPRRWSTAGDGWFVVPKVFEGWRDCPVQPDSWHQYGPSTGYQEHLPHSAAVSPGFWKGTEAEARLARDPARFAVDVDRQVVSKANWQIVTTFNEFGEGTAIEPTTEWGTTYLDILHARRYR